MKKERWIGTILFLGTFFLSCRDWFFKSKIILGHNWDFTFPGVDVIGKNAGIISNYMWSDFTGPTLMLQSLIANNNIYAMLVGLVGTSNTIRIIYFIMILVGYIGVRKLTRLYFGLNDIEASILGLLYAYSPFAFSIIIGGSWNAWISYAFSPLLIYVIYRIIIEGRTGYYWLLLPVSILSICYPHYFLIDNVIFLVILCFHLKDRKKIIVYAKRYLYLIVFYITVNIYWLLPFLYHIGDFNQKIYENSLITSFDAIRNSLQTPQNIIYQIGFNNRNFYISSLNKFQELIYLSAVSIIIIIILYSYFIKKNNKNIGPLELLLILFFILSSGGSGPLGLLSLSIHESFGILKMYRSPQNMFFSIIIISILILAKAIKEINSNKTVLILLACLPFYMVGWIITGDFGTGSLEKKNISHIDFYKSSNDIESMYLFYENISIINRPFFIPNTQSPLYIKKENQGGGQGGVAEYMYMKYSPYIINDKKQLISVYRDLENDRLLKILGERSVRYITVRNDISDYFNDLPEFYNRLVESMLSKKMKLEDKQREYSTYLVSNNDFKPIISLIELENLEDKKATIEFKKISPVRYDLKLRNINSNSNYKVIYNSIFNEKWGLYINNYIESDNENVKQINFDNYVVELININDQANIDEIKDYISKGKIDADVFFSDSKVKFISKEFSRSIQNDNMTLNDFSPLGKNLPNKFHKDIFENNININVYDINIEYFTKNYSHLMKKNKNGSFDISLSLYFKTQSIFYIGLLISMFSIILYLVLAKKLIK